MDVQCIDDPDDPRVEPYRCVQERDRVGRRGQLIAEGKVVVEQLLAPSSRFRPLSLLIAERHLETGVAALLARVPDTVPVLVAAQTVLDRIAGFAIHRGILALGERVEPAQPAHYLENLPARAIVVGLSGIANHDNMGGIFRNAAAFGVDLVLIDDGCCDPLYRKAIRVSVGAALRVPFARLAPETDPVDLSRLHGLEMLALTPHGTEPLAQVARPDRVAVWFGAEGPGLPDRILRRCRGVAIGMAAGFDSLNVATASVIVLYHLITMTRHRSTDIPNAMQ